MFAGMDFANGLAAVRKIAMALPYDMTMAQFALRWTLDQPGVTAVIPGARNPQQALANKPTWRTALQLHVDAQTMIADVYDELIRPHLHHHWYPRAGQRLRITTIASLLALRTCAWNGPTATDGCPR